MSELGTKMRYMPSTISGCYACHKKWDDGNLWNERTEVPLTPSSWGDRTGIPFWVLPDAHGSFICCYCFAGLMAFLFKGRETTVP